MDRNLNKGNPPGLGFPEWGSLRKKESVFEDSRRITRKAGV